MFTSTSYFLLVGSHNSDTEAPRQRYQSLTIPTFFSTEKTAFPIQSPFVCVALPTCLSVIKPVVLCIRLKVYSRGRQNYVTGHKWPQGPYWPWLFLHPAEPLFVMSFLLFNCNYMYMYTTITSRLLHLHPFSAFHIRTVLDYGEYPLW